MDQITQAVDRVEYWAYPTCLVQAKGGPTQTRPSRSDLDCQMESKR